LDDRDFDLHSNVPTVFVKAFRWTLVGCTPKLAKELRKIRKTPFWTEGPLSLSRPGASHPSICKRIVCQAIKKLGLGFKKKYTVTGGISCHSAKRLFIRKLHEHELPDRVWMAYLQMKDHKTYRSYAKDVECAFAGKVVTGKRLF